MKASPRPPLEVVEAEFFLELLVSLLADPARLDRRGQRLEAGFRRQVREIVFLLSGRAPLADEPNFVARHMLHALVADPLRLPVGDAHADSSEAGFQGSLGSFAPSEHAPFRLGEHVLSAEGEDIGHMPFAVSSMTRKAPAPPTSLSAWSASSRSS